MSEESRRTKRRMSVIVSLLALGIVGLLLVLFSRSDSGAKGISAADGDPTVTYAPPDLDSLTGPSEMQTAMADMLTHSITETKQIEIPSAPMDVTSVDTGLLSSDVLVRRAAAHDLSVDDPYGAGNPVLSLIIRALDDSDAMVRLSAADAAREVGTLYRIDVMASRQPNIDPTYQQDLQTTLLDATADDDEPTATSALLAYANIYYDDLELENAFATIYQSTQHDGVKAAIVNKIGERPFTSNSSVDILADARGDATSDIRGQAAIATAQVLGQAAVSILQDMLQTEADEYVRNAIQNALDMVE